MYLLLFSVSSLFCCFYTSYSQGKKRSVHDSFTDFAGENVASRTRSRRNSLLPNSPTPGVGITDNPEGIIRRQRVKRLAIRAKSPLGQRIENDGSSCSNPTTGNIGGNDGEEESGFHDRPHLAKVQTAFFQLF